MSLLIAGCIALAEYLADQPRFIRLDVRYNEIKAGGWLALSHATRLCPSLIRVDMSYDSKDLRHSDTIRDTMRIIQETCQANRERFDEGAAPTPSADNEPEEPALEKYDARINELFGAGTSSDDITITFTDTDKPVESSQAAGDACTSSADNQQKVEDGAATNSSELTDGQPRAKSERHKETELLNDSFLSDSDSSSQDFPVFIGSLGKDANSTLELDIPRKKGQEMALRRGSITSVTASGPLSVSDRLADELFPVRVRVHPIPHTSNPVIKGRFQISLVRATEKIYNSVQSVLSPVGNGAMLPLMNVHSSPREAPSSYPDGTKGLFNWRATFRRGSKDAADVASTTALVSPGADNEEKRLNGDNIKSSDRSGIVQLASPGETTKDIDDVLSSLPVLRT